MKLNKYLLFYCLTFSVSIQAQWDTTSIEQVIEDFNRPYRSEIDSKDSISIFKMLQEVSDASKANRSQVIISQLDSLSNSKTTMLCVVEAYLNQVVKHNWSEELIYYLWSEIRSSFLSYEVGSGGLFSGYYDRLAYYQFVTNNHEVITQVY